MLSAFVSISIKFFGIHWFFNINLFILWYILAGFPTGGGGGLFNDSFFSNDPFAAHHQLHGFFSGGIPQQRQQQRQQQQQQQQSSMMSQSSFFGGNGGFGGGMMMDPFFPSSSSSSSFSSSSSNFGGGGGGVSRSVSQSTQIVNGQAQTVTVTKVQDANVRYLYSVHLLYIMKCSFHFFLIDQMMMMIIIIIVFILYYTILGYNDNRRLWSWTKKSNSQWCRTTKYIRSRTVQW